MTMSQYFRVNKSHTKYNTITREGGKGGKGLFSLSVCTLMIASELILFTHGPLEWVTKGHVVFHQPLLPGCLTC